MTANWSISHNFQGMAILAGYLIVLIMPISSI